MKALLSIIFTKTKIIFPKLHIEFERWKYSTEYNCYVSNYGNIRNNDGVLKTPGVKSNYFYFRNIPVHRIVAETWIPTTDKTLSIDHVNRNTRDNRVCNLRWMSRKDNMSKATVEDFINLNEEITMAEIRQECRNLTRSTLHYCLVYRYNNDGSKIRDIQIFDSREDVVNFFSEVLPKKYFVSKKSFTKTFSHFHNHSKIYGWRMQFYRDKSGSMSRQENIV